MLKRIWFTLKPLVLAAGVIIAFIFAACFSLWFDTLAISTQRECQYWLTAVILTRVSVETICVRWKQSAALSEREGE